MYRGSPQVEDALRVLRYHLKFVVQMKNPRASGPEREWHTLNTLGTIVGKSNAYDIMNAEKMKHPPYCQWRVLPQNEADRYQQGIDVGKRLAAEELV